MTNENPPPSTDSRSRLATAAMLVVRLGTDLVAVSLWVLVLTLLFLRTGWPRPAFYALLLLGVAVYVEVTRPWVRAGSAAAD